MNNILFMNIFRRSDKLMHIILDLQLCQSLSPFDEFIQRLIFTQLQNDIDELGVFEAVLESDYILGLYFGVDLYLRGELKCFY